MDEDVFKALIDCTVELASLPKAVIGSHKAIVVHEIE